MGGLNAPLPVLVMIAGALASCSREAARPDLILITLDTTRSDALGCYGRSGDPTPHLDALAREGVRFTQARSVAPLTLPAHASMLTGLYPPRHTVRDNGQAVLPQSARTAAEILEDAGYETAAFVSAAVLDETWGIAQGFQYFDAPQNSGDSGAHVGERSGRDVIDRTLAWLPTREEKRPLFLWVHLFDPHAPYEPPADALARAGGNAYLGEVVETDRQVGRLLASLRASARFAASAVLVVADHGEALGQHGEPTHSALCYEPTIHVPLILRLPAGEQAGRVEDTLVSVADVFPTLLGLAGEKLPERIDGLSLLEPDTARAVYFESCSGWLNHGWSPLIGVATGREKYLWSEAHELYDLGTDPREKEDLGPSRTQRCRQLAELLMQQFRGPALRPDASTRIDPAQRERIRALGYAGAAEEGAAIPAPFTPTGLPRPKDSMPELRAYYEALLADARGEREQAIRALQSIVAANPAHYAAADYLGAALLSAGRAAEAEQMLLALARAGRARTTTAANLARACEAQGRLEEARGHWQQCAELTPLSREAWQQLLRLSESLGDAAGAQTARAALEKL